MDEVAELELPTQENVHADLRSVFQGAVKLALETVLDEVVRDSISAERRRYRPSTYCRPAR
jgi:putative transposase